MLKMVQGDVLELCFHFDNIDPVAIKRVVFTSKDLNLCEEAKPNCCGYIVRILGSRTKDFTIGFLKFDVSLHLFLLKLIEEKILIEPNQYKELKKSFEDAQFCVECCANDFMIPGLEFDENGKCPICQNWDKVEKLKSVNTIAKNIPINPKGLYDVAIFYTGGKILVFYFGILQSSVN